MLKLSSLRSNLALCLVLWILFPILLNHMLFISLHVQAVEFVILVKPIGISTHVLMSISFGTKIPTFLNILVLLKVVGMSVISLVLRFPIMPALTLLFFTGSFKFTFFVISFIIPHSHQLNLFN